MKRWLWGVGFASIFLLLVAVNPAPAWAATAPVAQSAIQQLIALLEQELALLEQELAAQNNATASPATGNRGGVAADNNL